MIAELLRENGELKNIEHNKILLLEKQRYIEHLLKENKQIQNHYNQIISNIVGQDKIVETINKISQRMEDQEKSHLPKSYAIVVSNQLNVSKRSLTSFIIKPKEKQSSLETKRELNKNIDLSKIQVKVEAVNNLKDGGVEIKVQEEDLIKLKNAAENLPKNYEIVEQKKIQPRIKIIGYRSKEKPNAEELRDKIIHENFYIKREDFKVTLINYIASKNKLLHYICGGQWKYIQKNYRQQ
nr:unnamed protein product [Callosobruchus chinensis]